MVALVSLFGTALAVSAGLLFTVQPMFAKLLLPNLGGAPAVWIVCASFYQGAVLVGYLYAHLLARSRSVARQAGMHIALLIAAGLLLPPSLRGGAAAPVDQPILWLLARLTIGVGPLVVLLSATAPLFGTWFARTKHPWARDPYLLYAASNAGSLAGLLSYPLAFEPLLPLSGQSRAWAAGYAGFVGLAIACALRVRATPPVPPRPIEVSSIGNPAATRGGSPARWLFVAFVPSSLYLGFTTWVTTDLAAIPLFWVIPLALYLGSFVLAFARRPAPASRTVPLIVQPPILFVVAIATLAGGGGVSVWTLAAHFFALAVSCLVCLQELFRSRPGSERQTEYFVWVAMGGVAAGIFNAIVAPHLFTSPVEYPLALVLTCLGRPRSPPRAVRAGAHRAADILLPLGYLIILLELARRQAGPAPLTIAAAAGALLFIAGAANRARLTAGFAALTLAASLHAHGLRHTLLADRTFFGIHRVRQDGDLHVLLHGDTRHGVQDQTAARRRDPLGYHTRTSPVGEILSSPRPIAAVAVVGLGAGALAAYGRPGQRFTFFELDPLVETIARDPALFTYLRDCPADPNVILGDARLSLAAATDPAYDVIVVDAFSSDAIPIHLVTREGIAIYLSRLSPGGVLIFNVSNRYVRLAPVLAAVGRDLGLIAWRASDLEVSEPDLRAGKLPSEWVVLTRAPTDLANFTEDTRWHRLAADPEAPGWTDQRSNLIGALRRER